MKIDNIDVGKTIDKAKKLLKEEKNISLSLRAVFELILILMHAMLIRLSLNSKNSSKPPSTDLNPKKKRKNK